MSHLSSKSDDEGVVVAASATKIIHNNNNKYLALVPRGLQQVISDIILQETKNDANICIIGEEEYDDSGITNKTGLEAQQALREHHHRQANHHKKKNKTPKTKTTIMDQWCQHPVGSVELSKKNHVSVGYTSKQSATWSCPGQLSGSVWLQIQTPDLSAMASSRCLGPLMALVTVGNLNILATREKHSMEEMTREVSQWISSASCSYRQDLDSALGLWKEHIQASWKGRPEISEEDYNSLQERIQSNRLRFRLSCVRENSDLPYSRSDLLKSIMDECGTDILPYYHASGWKVDLTKYDIEMVLILLSSGTVAIGFSLCPYSFLKSNSFACGGVPPDITPPFIGGDLLSGGIVRLRPTTAHVLLKLANLEPYEVVLDPCAGIGTIPVEADQYYCGNNTIGLGGDIVLHHPTIATAASALEQKKSPPTTRSHRPKSSSSLLATWDAAHLPIRGSSVDAIVSDLPFGKQCLSANALHQLLPLILTECARVLVPTKGRMVLLCGAPNAILQALEESKLYWVQPCTMISPVSIGGLLAWMVRVERNELTYDDSHNEHPTRNYFDRVRKLAKKRDRIADLQKNGKESSPNNANESTSKKKSRIQS